MTYAIAAGQAERLFEVVRNRRDIYERDPAAPQSDYAELCQHLPHWIRQNGLQCTLEYLAMRASNKPNGRGDTAARHLLDDWWSDPGGRGQPLTLRSLADKGEWPRDGPSYRLASRSGLREAEWLRRYSQLLFDAAKDGAFNVADQTGESNVDRH